MHNTAVQLPCWKEFLLAYENDAVNRQVRIVIISGGKEAIAINILK
jgi:hypothetical protein